MVTPPLPEEVAIVSDINGWEYDPESPMNGHVWYDADNTRSLAVSLSPGDRAYAKVRDERVSGFNRGEIVASSEYESVDDLTETQERKRACVGEVLEDAIDWMRATAPTEWSHPRIDETIFEAPVGYELVRVFVEERETVIYYERADIDIS